MLIQYKFHLKISNGKTRFDISKKSYLPIDLKFLFRKIVQLQLSDQTFVDPLMQRFFSGCVYQYFHFI